MSEPKPQHKALNNRPDLVENLKPITESPDERAKNTSDALFEGQQYTPDSRVGYALHELGDELEKLIHSIGQVQDMLGLSLAYLAKNCTGLSDEFIMPLRKEVIARIEVWKLYKHYRNSPDPEAPKE